MRRSHKLAVAALLGMFWWMPSYSTGPTDVTAPMAPSTPQPPPTPTPSPPPPPANAARRSDEHVKLPGSTAQLQHIANSATFGGPPGAQSNGTSLPISCTALLSTLTAQRDARRVEHDTVMQEGGIRALARRYCVALCNPEMSNLTESVCCVGASLKLSDFVRVTPASAEITALAREAAANPDEISLVTQGSPDRLGVLAEVTAAWQGPMVVVLAVYNNTNAPGDIAKANHQFKSIVTAAATQRPNVQMFVYTVRYAPRSDWFAARLETNSKITLYPVNTLRNVAMDRAWTNWVFPSDADFVPSRTLYNSFKTLHAPALYQVGPRQVFSA